MFFRFFDSVLVLIAPDFCESNLDDKAAIELFVSPVLHMEAVHAGFEQFPNFFSVFPGVVICSHMYLWD